ncbi:MAG: hypothetical protein K2W95_04235 [Candidatus Obscuribacterales bacterium]|nr:hypothetical protein [Candidatus Obscuribacterales bacterium]
METAPGKNYIVEALSHSSDVTDQICREASLRGLEGLHLVEACTDENRAPALIYEKGVPEESEFAVEIIPVLRNQDDLSSMKRTLNKSNSAGWRLITVLDQPLSRPLAIFKRSKRRYADELLSILVLAKPRTVAEELITAIYEYEAEHGCKLRTALHTGISPVLIFGEWEPVEYEYTVAHCSRTLLQHQSERISDLISAFALSGCEVCAAFEDERLTPCVVFRRGRPIDSGE